MFQILLTVIRLYGSSSKLEIKYKTEADTAQADLDFKDIKTGLLSMNPGQMSATLSVQVCARLVRQILYTQE